MRGIECDCCRKFVPFNNGQFYCVRVVLSDVGETYPNLPSNYEFCLDCYKKIHDAVMTDGSEK